MGIDTSQPAPRASDDEATETLDGPSGEPTATLDGVVDDETTATFDGVSHAPATPTTAEQTTAPFAPPPKPATPRAAKPDSPRGRTIGPYTLLELLGEGGMGSVYLAEQEKPLRRKVALKLMQASWLGPKARARFEAERQALARLEHPNVGRILDAGTTTDGQLFFAMEWVKGERLTTYCDRRRLTIEERIELMIAVCRGVEHAHRRQLLHRDLKPSNILVEEVDGRPVPKIIDFGIAKALDQPLTDHTLLTGDLLLGTPAYMSPEALDGSGDVDTRGDVYALGMVLYELLSGERPFATRQSSLPQILRQVLEDEPPRPSSRFATVAGETQAVVAARRRARPPELRRRLSGDLDWIVLRAIAKQRDDRYGSAAELATDLEHHLRFEPVEAGPPGAGYRVAKFVRRNRGRLTVAALLAGLLLGSLALEVRGRWRADRLGRASQEMGREAERIEWLQRVLHQGPPRDLSAEQRRLRIGMAKIAGQMEALGDLGRGPGSYSLGRGALALGELETARRHLEDALATGYRPAEVSLALGLALGELWEQRLESILRLPDRETRGRERARAEVALRDPALRHLAAGRRAETATPALLDARIALYRGELGEALAAAERATQNRPWLWEAHLIASRAWQRRATEARAAGDPGAAEAALADAEAAARRALELGRSDPEAHFHLCRIHGEQLGLMARYARPGIDALHAAALEACGTVRRIVPGHPGADYEEVMVWANLADVQVWDRTEDPSASLDRARQVLRRVLETRPESETPYRLMGRTWTILATHLRRQGEDPRPAMAEAVDWLEQALDRAPGLLFIHLALSDQLAARAAYASDQGEDPTPDLARVVHHCEAVIAESPDNWRAHYSLARANITQGFYRLEHGLDPMAALDRAEAAFRRGDAIDPAAFETANGLATLGILRGKWLLKSGGDPGPAIAEGAEAAERAVARRPESPFSRFTQGHLQLVAARHALASGGDPTPAITASRTAYAHGLDKLPRIPGPHAELAELALVEARHRLAGERSPMEAVTAAGEHARRALAIDGGRADAQRARGLAQLVAARWQAREGRDPGMTFEKARGSLSKALELSDDAPANLAMARYYLVAAGGCSGGSAPAESVDSLRVDRGVEHARRARALDPALVEARAIEGALLSLSAATRAAGCEGLDEARASNANLETEWGRWPGCPGAEPTEPSTR